MSRIVPVYIDLNSGKHIIFDSEINESLKVYKVSIETASSTWIVTHTENTINVLVKAYINGEEVTPDSVVINDSLRITVTFNTPVVGELHIFMFNLDQLVAPTPTVTPNPTLTPTPTVSVSLSPQVTPTITTTVTPQVTPTPSPSG